MTWNILGRSGSSLRITVLLAACAATSGCGSESSNEHEEVGQDTAALGEGSPILYADAPSAGWTSWSWGTTPNFSATSPTFGGARSIAFTATTAWAGLYLHNPTGVATSATGNVDFAVYARQAGQTYSVVLYDTNDKPLRSAVPLSTYGALTAGAWKRYTIPLSQLNAAGKVVKGFSLQDTTGRAGATAYVDEIRVSAAAAPAPVATGDCLGVPSYPELRPTFDSYNKAVLTMPPFPADHWMQSFKPYYQQITGSCHGSTEQILEWAVRKWGLDKLGPGLVDLGKASAIVESWWRQTFLGDGGDSGSILQLRRTSWPGAETAWKSTALAADYWGAAIRAHYDGVLWLGEGTRGSIRNSVAAWQCGCKFNGNGEYTNRVFAYIADKPWNHPFTPPWLGYY